MQLDFLKPQYTFNEYEKIDAYQNRSLSLLLILTTLFSVVLTTLFFVLGEISTVTPLLITVVSAGGYILLQQHRRFFRPVLHAILLLFITVVLFFFQSHEAAISLLTPIIIMAFILGGKKCGTIYSLIALLPYLYLLIETHSLSDNLLFLLGINLFLALMMFHFATMLHTFNNLMRLKGDSFEQLPTNDALTGIMNRRLFLQMANKYLHKAKRKQLSYYLLHLNLDNFSSITEKYGEAKSNEVLQSISENIICLLRKNDLFGRIEEDGFGIVILENSMDDAKIVAQKIRLMVESLSFTYDRQSFWVTCSIGIASSDTHRLLDTILSAANSALLLAKESGKNCIRTENELHEA